MQSTRNEAAARRFILEGRILRALGAAMLLAAVLSPPTQGQEIPKARAQAPANHALLKGGLGGGYFVTKALREKYDRLVREVAALEAEIDAGGIAEADAAREIHRLIEDLNQTRADIEKQKVFVPAAKVRTRSETTTFDLGSERCLLICAGKVRIEGWDEPRVKCVLDMTVLSAGDQPADDQFKALKIVHQHRRAPERVGKTREELEAGQKAQDSAPGARPPDQKQLDSRRKFNEKYLASCSLFRPLQGKEIDLLEIEGLTYEQGNRQVRFEVESAGGEDFHGADWQRHASLTIYVPPCRIVAVLGGLGGLDVESLQASMVVRGTESRDYHAVSKILHLQGSLAVEGVPIQMLADVEGDVSITLTAPSEDSGVRHEGNMRTAYIARPDTLECGDIRGNLRARICRANLVAGKILGTIDVKNEFGETFFRADNDQPMANKAHRIVSESGRIEVVLPGNLTGAIPLAALTECGTVRTIGADDTLENVQFTTHSGDQQVTRTWRGFATRQNAAAPSMALFERPAEVLLGKERSPGLDLISRAGSIRIHYGNVVVRRKPIIHRD